MARRYQIGLPRIVSHALPLIACLVGGFFLYRHFTQVELTFVNRSGRQLSDVQLYQKPDRFFLGTVAAGGNRIVTIPVYSIKACQLSFVPEKLHRKYYKCPEYLYAGAHAEWVVLPNGTVKGKTAVIPFVWQSDGEPFNRISSLRD